MQQQNRWKEIDQRWNIINQITDFDFLDDSTSDSESEDETKGSCSVEN